MVPGFATMRTPFSVPTGPPKAEERSRYSKTCMTDLADMTTTILTYSRNPALFVGVLTGEHRLSYTEEVCLWKGKTLGRIFSCG